MRHKTQRRHSHDRYRHHPHSRLNPIKLIDAADACHAAMGTPYARAALVHQQIGPQALTCFNLFKTKQRHTRKEAIWVGGAAVIIVFPVVHKGPGGRPCCPIARHGAGRVAHALHAGRQVVHLLVPVLLEEGLLVCGRWNCQVRL